MLDDEVTVKKEEGSQSAADKWHTMFDEKKEDKLEAPPVCDTSAFPTIKVCHFDSNREGVWLNQG